MVCGLIPKERNPMKRLILPILIAAGVSLETAARADEIQFTTLPQPVQTTVIRETHIPGPNGVVRVIRDSDGVYAVTVRSEGGEHVVYVNDSGAIVLAPGTTTVQTTQPSVDSRQRIVTYDDVQKDQSRYQLLEKKGKKEVYLDRQTGQKVTVKREEH
jgi:hypothetical protein